MEGLEGNNGTCPNNAASAPVGGDIWRDNGDDGLAGQPIVAHADVGNRIGGHGRMAKAHDAAATFPPWCRDGRQLHAWPRGGAPPPDSASSLCCRWFVLSCWLVLDEIFF